MGLFRLPLLHCSHTLQNVKNDQAPFFLTQKPDVAIHLGIKKKKRNQSFFFQSESTANLLSLNILRVVEYTSTDAREASDVTCEKLTFEKLI